MSINLTTRKQKKWCRGAHSPYLWWSVFALCDSYVKSHNGRVDTPRLIIFQSYYNVSFVIYNPSVKQQQMFSSWLLFVYVLFFLIFDLPQPKS